MKLTIKSHSQPDLVFTVTVPDNSTVLDVKTLCVVAAPPGFFATNRPSAVRLLANGRILDLMQARVATYGVVDGSVCVAVTGEVAPTAVPASQPAAAAPKPARRKKTCGFAACTLPPAKFIGDCNYCHTSFCLRHRLVEDHQCLNLQNCHKEYHDANAGKLFREQTVENKV